MRIPIQEQELTIINKQINLISSLSKGLLYLVGFMIFYLIDLSPTLKVLSGLSNWGMRLINWRPGKVFFNFNDIVLREEQKTIQGGSRITGMDLSSRS
jgi:hypothetical protein